MAEPERLLNQLSAAEARALLVRCCGAGSWVDGMLARRPFASHAALLAAAEAVWAGLAEADYLEAFAHHPRIGEDLAALRARFPDTAAWASTEQAGASAADEPTLLALRDENRAYFERFGFIFIVCASGKSARELLALLRDRLRNERARELTIAAAEQAKITRLRLEKLSP
jgi:2-oxo-4-hydroxy-4-carboxy-5-ureidoimidazoline decarboxylase